MHIHGGTFVGCADDSSHGRKKNKTDVLGYYPMNINLNETFCSKAPEFMLSKIYICASEIQMLYPVSQGGGIFSGSALSFSS